MLMLLCTAEMGWSGCQPACEQCEVPRLDSRGAIFYNPTNRCYLWLILLKDIFLLDKCDKFSWATLEEWGSLYIGILV